MVVRSRSRYLKPISGTVNGWFSNGSPSTATRSYPGVFWESMVDQVEVGNGGRMTLDKYFHKGVYPTFSGSNIIEFGKPVRYTNWPLSPFGDPKYDIAHYSSFGGVPSAAAAATELAAMTNPSRPLIDIPVFAKELTELPELLLKRSGDVGRDIASGRLSLEFGWKPLIGDLLKLLDFKKEFDARVQELLHLEKTGIRRKRKLFSDTSPPFDRTTGTDTTTGLNCVHLRESVTTIEVSGFMRWKPDMEPARLLGIAYDRHRDINLKAYAALAGISNTIIDASTIWELVPYSWLADWCTNAGDYLAAHRNIVGAVPDGKVQVMFHRYTEQVVKLSGAPTSRFSQLEKSTLEFVRIHETKERVPTSLEVEAHLPFLNERKIAILADLIRGSYYGRR